MATEAEVYEALKYRIEVDKHGTRRYYNSANQQHCDDGPAVVWRDGDLEWYHNGLRHRTDGPAVEYATGTKEWWINGELHRDVGPAIERSDGTKEWWINDELHRIDGAAVEYADGNKEWWLYGVRYTEQAYRVKLAELEQTLEPTT